jgi:hypothetical protein
MTQIVCSTFSESVVQLSCPRSVVRKPEVAFAPRQMAVCDPSRFDELLYERFTRLCEAGPGYCEALIPHIEG